MNKMKKRIYVALISLSIFLLTELNWSGDFLQFKRMHNTSFIEPLSYIAGSLFLTCTILMFVSNDALKKWVKYCYWFLPIAGILIISGSTESSYIWPSRSDFSLFFGTILVITTLIFALIQKFIYKK